MPKARAARVDAEEFISQKIVVTKDSKERAVSFNTAEKPEIKWNGTIVVESLSSESNDEITSTTGTKTAPLTRHIHVHDKDRAVQVELSSKEMPQDPLLQRERFLNRVNRAHDLNTLETALTTQAQPVTKEVKPLGSEIKEESKLFRTIYSGAITCVLLMWVIAPFCAIIQRNTYYINGTDGQTGTSYYQRGFSLTSAEEIKNNTVSLISNIRDILKNKR